jgi:hypothetical protein
MENGDEWWVGKQFVVSKKNPDIFLTGLGKFRTACNSAYLTSLLNFIPAQKEICLLTTCNRLSWIRFNDSIATYGPTLRTYYHELLTSATRVVLSRTNDFQFITPENLALSRTLSWQQISHLISRLKLINVIFVFTCEANLALKYQL